MHDPDPDPRPLDHLALRGAPGAAALVTREGELDYAGLERPKGVMLSHANLWLGAVSVAHYLDLSPQDRTIGVLPLSFDYGQNQLLSTWAAGGCAIPI